MHQEVSGSFEKKISSLFPFLSLFLSLLCIYACLSAVLGVWKIAS